MLRGKAVFKGQNIEARGLGELGGKHLGIAEVPAGIASAVAVQHGALVPVGPLQPHPRRGHSGKVKGLPAHVRHVGGEIAQKLLTPALALQLLHRHDLRRSGAVEGLEYPHGGSQTAAFGGFALLGKRGFEYLAGLVHDAPSFSMMAS
ncbi:hypothetical protein SDC9_84320 [bioreactor metagenome]|uniref:Uncharacterized protein n=1 Tax=bioreactor metagenome TaxID=1076179 RepID=A0A644ZCU3_9ZZZZ